MTCRGQLTMLIPVLTVRHAPAGKAAQHDGGAAVHADR